MCDVCDRNYGSIEITIKDANTETKYCPNCLISSLYYGELIFTPDLLLRCDVTGEFGAVLYLTEEESYTLKPDIMMRLIARNLLPNEYFALIHKYDESNYMLHDDFYTEEGEAINPIELESTNEQELN